MVKKGKKRSISESETVQKAVEESAKVNITMKNKRLENGAVQNGQANKKVKKDAQKKVKVENKKEQNTVVVQTPNKKETNEVKSEKKNKKHENKDKSKSPKKKHSVKSDLPVEALKARIEDIKKRGNLSKTAKRKLAQYQKLVSMKEGTYVPSPQVPKQKAEKAKNVKSIEAAKKKQVENNKEGNKKVPAKVEAKSNKNNKKDNKQGKLLLKKQNKDEEEDEEDEELEKKPTELEFYSDTEDEEDVDDEEEDEDEEEEEEDEDDDDEEDEEEEAKPNNVQSPKGKEKSKQTPEQDGKKKRYVLFVGNLPYSITAEELKKHFLTKVSQVVHIRIPKKDDNQGRGFAYVELANNTDYEKALTLNHSFVNGRRINVQYSKGAGDRKEVVAKNMKLQALTKAGKLAGAPNKNKQKNAGKKGKQNAQATKT